MRVARLVRQVAVGAALFLGAAHHPRGIAGRPLAAGLLSELAGPGEDAAAVARARVLRMLGRAPLSFAAAKRLLQLAADVDLRSGMLAESLAQAALLQSDDHREGLAAARERREPDFQGS